MHVSISDTIIQSEKKAPDLLKLTIPILIEATLYMMLGFVDVFLLGHYNDLAASGVNAANQVITVLSMVLSTSPSPRMSRWRSICAAWMLQR